MWYRINWDKLIVLLLPTGLRSSKIVGLLQAFVRPLVELHSEWTVFRNANIKRLSTPPLVCYIRGALNDAFDPDFRRVLIVNSELEEPLYISTPDQNDPIYLDDEPVWIVSAKETLNSGIDFLVKVPLETYETRLNEVKAEINAHVPAGKTYNVLPL